MKQTKVEIELDKKRYLEFTWEAIDYITGKYDSFGKCLQLAAGIDNPMKMTKEAVGAAIDLMVALLKADDPEITPEQVKQIMPLAKMNEYSEKITLAIQYGEDQAGADSENPQSPAK